METINTILNISQSIINNDNKKALIKLDELIAFKSTNPKDSSNQSWYTLLTKFRSFYLDHVNSLIDKDYKIPFSIFKHGNGKHPFINYSTIPVTNCPGSAECETFCYSKNSMRFPLAVCSWLQNQILESYYFDIIEKEFDIFVNQPKYKKLNKIDFRLYNDGDFRTISILKKWMEFLKARKNINCYGYTKSLHFLKTLSIENYKFPNNYKVNISSGGKYDALGESELIKKLNIYRGNFISHKLDKVFKTSKGYSKQDVKNIRNKYDKKVFICPLVCGSCTKIGHACGSDKFDNMDIIIPIH